MKYRYKILFSVAFLIPQLLFGYSSNLTKRFIKNIELPVENGEKVDEVYFGNKQYGYFKPASFQVDSRRLKFELIPPGYKYPLEIYLKKTSGGKIRSTRKVEMRFPWIGAIKQRFLNTANRHKSRKASLFFAPPGPKTRFFGWDRA